MEILEKDCSSETHIVLLQMFHVVFKKYAIVGTQCTSGSLLLFAFFEVRISAFVSFHFL